MIANVDELWRELSRSDVFPREAIETSLANWDQVSDRYLGKLRAMAGGAKLSGADRDALLVVIHMFAEKRDVRAYAPLCMEMTKAVNGESWLGDSIASNIKSILISLYDGDPSPLRAVVEATGGDVWLRAAALQAMGYLTRTRAEDAMSDEEMRDFLRAFGQNLSDADDPALGGVWAMVVAELGYSDLAPDVARAISRNVVEPELCSMQDFHADLRLALDDPSGLAAFHADQVEPFGSTIEALSRWSWAPKSEDLGQEPKVAYDPFAYTKPHVNPLRDVGRNDPCPCGSGKKYKKCCLAA